VREVQGEMNLRAARIHTMLGQVAKQRGRLSEAIDHFCAAWEVRECIDGADGEETIRMHVRIAEVEHQAGKLSEAIDRQRKVVAMLQRQKAHAVPLLLIDSCSQLSRWLEAHGARRSVTQTPPRPLLLCMASSSDLFVSPSPS